MTPASSAAPTEDQVRTRPRVEGERELEILDAALDTLAVHGYDKFTFETVATAAKASKATLYRRWDGKVDLLVDALQLLMGVEADHLPDTGSLRGDLLAHVQAKGGLGDERQVQIFSQLLNAVHKDADLKAAVITRLLGPKTAITLQMFRAAQQRGEIGKDADLEQIARLLPAICIYESLLTGANPAQDQLVTLVDTVVLPVCAATLPRD